MFNGTTFEPGAGPLPNGEDPYTLVSDWRGWVEECLVLLDGDGRFRHLPYPGTYRQQPDYDMAVLQVIRGEWNRLQNEKIRRQTERGRR